MKYLSELDYIVPFEIGKRSLFKKRLKLKAYTMSYESMLSGKKAGLARRLGDASEGSELILNVPAAGRPTLSREGDRLVYVMQRKKLQSVSLKGSFEGYFALRFSPKVQEALRQSEARFADASGRLDFRVYRGAQGFRQFLQEAKPFGRQVKPFPLADRDDVLAFALFYGQEAAAFVCLQQTDDRYICVVDGENEKFHPLSVGSVLYLALIRHLFDEGQGRYLELPTTGQRAHSPFANLSIQCSDVLRLKSTPLNRLLLSSNLALRKLSALLAHKRSMSPVPNFSLRQKLTPAQIAPQEPLEDEFAASAQP